MTGRPIHVQDDGYSASQTCKACHPSQYESWHRSYHRTMTQVATPETVRADFDGQRVDEVQGQPMQLQRRDRTLWAEFDDPDWNGLGGSSPRISREIVMTTGSHNQEVYWYRTGAGRLLGQLPGTFLIPDRRWIPRRMVFLQPPRDRAESGTAGWNKTCIRCHATEGKPKVAQRDTTVAEFGIACEACHGPSDEHARLNRSPVRRYLSHLTGRPDASTVQPARLESTRSSQVCGQCHGVWRFRDPAADERHFDAAGFPYRPGQDLLANRVLVRPSVDKNSPTMLKLRLEEPSYIDGVFWSDGMVRVSGREYNGLVDSPCFANAKEPKRTMTCFSCHSMHTASDDPRSQAEWADTHQVSASMTGNAACLQCHSKFDGNVAAHTKHQPASSGSSCYNCHMPYTTYGLLKGLRSHQISSPTVAASQATGRPNACNLCHLDKSLGWTADNLERWYGTSRTDLDNDERSVAASLLWLLRGDAGQRALAAWAMGWKPAQEISGTDWMGAYLSGLLEDNYDALRYIGYRSLRTLPPFANLPFRFVTSPQQRQRDVTAALAVWRQTSRASRSNPALLMNGDGSFMMDQLNRLLGQRNHRPIHLNE